MTMIAHMQNWGSATNESRWDSLNVGYGRYTDLGCLDISTSKVMARDYHQGPGGVGFRLAASSLSNRIGKGLLYPNRSDNGAYIQSDPVMVIVDGPDFRGYMPGIRNPLSYGVGMDKTVSKNLPNMPGKSLLNLLISGEPYTSSSIQTMVCFDIIGPWR